MTSFASPMLPLVKLTIETDTPSDRSPCAVLTEYRYEKGLTSSTYEHFSYTYEGIAAANGVTFILLQKGNGPSSMRLLPFNKARNCYLPSLRLPDIINRNTFNLVALSDTNVLTLWNYPYLHFLKLSNNFDTLTWLRAVDVTSDGPEEQRLYGSESFRQDYMYRRFFAYETERETYVIVAKKRIMGSASEVWEIDGDVSTFRGEIAVNGEIHQAAYCDGYAYVVVSSGIRDKTCPALHALELSSGRTQMVEEFRDGHRPDLDISLEAYVSASATSYILSIHMIRFDTNWRVSVFDLRTRSWSYDVVSLWSPFISTEVYMRLLRNGELLFPTFDGARSVYVQAPTLGEVATCAIHRHMPEATARRLRASTVLSAVQLLQFIYGESGQDTAFA